MKIKVINGLAPDFGQRADRIVELYNKECAAFQEASLTIMRAETLNLIYVEGVEGGIITDKHYDQSGNLLFNSVMYAAFPEYDRRKGYLQACLKHAGFPIDAIQVQYGDPMKVWKHLGFNELRVLGISCYLINRDIPEVDWNRDTVVFR